MHPFDRLIQITQELRQKCPWDKAQTFETLKATLLEETYEVMEALDANQSKLLQEELGDLLLQVSFLSNLAQESGWFDIYQVVNSLSEKLVRRHPHVYGDVKVNSAAEANQSWNIAKQQEAIKKNRSILDGVPQHLPALLQAQRIGEKASKVGFDWNQINGIMDKIEEEWQELKEALSQNQTNSIYHELGDVFFALTNLARFIEMNAEESLRQATLRFKKRFQFIENKAREENKVLSDYTLQQLEKWWQEAKKKKFDR